MAASEAPALRGQPAKQLHERLRVDGAIREIHAGIYVQGHGRLYDEHLGFCHDRSLIYDPDELIT